MEGFPFIYVFIGWKGCPTFWLNIVYFVAFFVNYYICYWNQIILLHSVICIILAFSQKILMGKGGGGNKACLLKITMQINTCLPEYTVSYLRELWSWPTEYL